MVASDEGMRILRMLEQGQIDAEDAAKLLEALGEELNVRPTGRGQGAKWVKVRVTDTRTGKKKVNINIPMGLARMGLGMAAQFSPRVPSIDFDEVLSAIKDGQQGHIVQVENDEEGERVEVYIE